jgi:hypothetical protein
LKKLFDKDKCISTATQATLDLLEAMLKKIMDPIDPDAPPDEADDNEPDTEDDADNSDDASGDPNDPDEGDEAELPDPDAGGDDPNDPAAGEGNEPDPNEGETDPESPDPEESDPEEGQTGGNLEHACPEPDWDAPPVVHVMGQTLYPPDNWYLQHVYLDPENPEQINAFIDSIAVEGGRFVFAVPKQIPTSESYHDFLELCHERESFYNFIVDSLNTLGCCNFTYRVDDRDGKQRFSGTFYLTKVRKITIAGTTYDENSFTLMNPKNIPYFQGDIGTIDIEKGNSMEAFEENIDTFIDTLACPEGYTFGVRRSLMHQIQPITDQTERGWIKENTLTPGGGGLFNSVWPTAWSLTLYVYRTDDLEKNRWYEIRTYLRCVPPNQG